jgi:hypothetical protein
MKSGCTAKEMQSKVARERQAEGKSEEPHLFLVCYFEGILSRRTWKTKLKENKNKKSGGNVFVDNYFPKTEKDVKSLRILQEEN